MRLVETHRGTSPPKGWFDWVLRKPVSLKTHRKSSHQEALKAANAEIRNAPYMQSYAHRRGLGDEDSRSPDTDDYSDPSRGSNGLQTREFRSRRPVETERGPDRGFQRESLSKYRRGPDRGHQRERQADFGRTQQRDSQTHRRDSQTQWRNVPAWTRRGES